ncbi:YncE family protein [Mycobacterium sp. NPDC050041]|uniref:YncE family protein n=1 Tax=Mycobacterium sp. NPDC050041 TaxID=3364293 RepID=UPI003C2DBC23
MANIFTRASRAAHDEPLDDVITTDHDLTVIGSVAIGRPIGDLTVDPDSGAVVATHLGVRAVSVLDADAAAVTALVRAPGEPFAVAATGDRAYVTTMSSTTDGVAVIDTVGASVLAEYPLAFGVTAIAVSPDGKKVFAGRTGYDHVDVAVIDTTAERAGTIDLATGPGINVDALRVDAAGKRLYVAASDSEGSRLLVVDVETTQIVATIRIGAPIRDLALGEDGTAHVLTSHRTLGGAIEIVDLSTNRVTDTVEIGRAPVQLALSADGSRAYVVDYNHVAVLCTRTNEVLHTVQVAARPSCIALSVDGSRLYVADYAGTVTAFAVAAMQPLVYSHTAATDRIPAQARELVAV